MESDYKDMLLDFLYSIGLNPDDLNLLVSQSFFALVFVLAALTLDSWIRK